MHMNKEPEPLKIDFSLLMDLRVDYAFKLLFAKGDPRMLISLLNAIFANQKIPRVIKSLAIMNPNLERESGGDKLSILDIRAELDDGTSVLIEMHVHGLGEIKAKTIRSWARAYGEVLEIGGSYTSQPPTVTIAFTDGQVEPLENNKNPDAGKNDEENNDKIHRLCMIMDVEDFTIPTNAMELHYIDMKAFVKAVNKTDSASIDDTEKTMFDKWLSVITQKEITDKSIIEDACKDEEEIYMAVSALERLNEDKYYRQAYARRQDEIYYHNKALAEKEQAERRTEQAELEIEQMKREKEQMRHEKEQMKTEIGKLRQEVAMLQANQKT